MKISPTHFLCAAFAVALFGFWSTWPSRLPAQLPGESTSDYSTRMGQYGDSYGALNTLFTGLALLGVVISIAMQMHANRARERERSQELVEERFYRLADAFRKLVAEIRVRDAMFQVKEGRDALAVMAVEVRNQPLNPITTPAGLSAAQIFVHQYQTTYGGYTDDLGPYFRLLYHTIRVVHASEFDEPEKQLFAIIIRAELSASELFLVAANGLTPLGKNFKPLVIKYHLLKHLPDADKKIFELEYPSAAFE